MGLLFESAKGPRHDQLSHAAEMEMTYIYHKISRKIKLKLGCHTEMQAVLCYHLYAFLVRFYCRLKKEIERQHSL